LRVIPARRCDWASHSERFAGRGQESNWLRAPRGPILRDHESLLAKRRKRSTAGGPPPTQAGDIGYRRHDSEVRSWPVAADPGVSAPCPLIRGEADSICSNRVLRVVTPTRTSGAVEPKSADEGGSVVVPMTTSSSLETALKSLDQIRLETPAACPSPGHR
jgi:hypothetical protein